MRGIIVFGCLILVALPACSKQSNDVGEEVGVTNPAPLFPDATSTTTTIPAKLPDASLTPLKGTRVGSNNPAYLSSVRVSTGSGYERVALEFSNDAVPVWNVRYRTGPFQEDGVVGEAGAVEGKAFVVISLVGASGYDLKEKRLTYDGSARVPGRGTKHIIDVVRTADFQGVMSWVIALKDVRRFRVVTLEKPSRLLVDLATT